tara:strand:- start:92 stop:1111 length:1020 start_codon:yes stop_codon:yes gene_type:complete
MKYNKNLNNGIKSLLSKTNGKLVKEDLLVLPSEVDWNYKSNQTRDGDLDKGHLASLTADINSRGILNKPIVEFDKTSGLYNVVSGHHRISAIKSLLKEEGDKIPCASVQFSSKMDRELFMQGENHHPPTKPHTIKDAVRFIKNMRSYGYFDSADGDNEVLKAKAFSLLEKHYCRLNETRKNSVFHESFKDREMTRVLTVLKDDLQKTSNTLKEGVKPFKWKDNNYYCTGDTNNIRKSVAVSLEARIRDLDEGRVKVSGSRGKISILTFFSCKNVKDLQEEREKFLKTETLLNRHCWTPGKLIVIDEISFMPQIDGKQGVKESSSITYKWDYSTESFIKQ